MRNLSWPVAVVLFAALPVSGGEPRPAPNWSTTPTAWDSGDYKYDGAGNVIQIGDDSYTYDVLGRLTYATAKSPVSSDDFQQYEYDSYGNLKRVTTTSRGGTESVEAFRINKNTNQLNGTEPCVTPYDICFEGEYDGAGRQTGIIPDENRYEWTPLGEVKGVNLSSRRERYIYDANGERIVKIDLDTGGRLFTLRNGANQVVREISYDPSTQWTWNRDYVYRGNKLIAGFVAGEAGAGPYRNYHLDHLGTPRLLTDAAGYKQSIHAYWPFGKEAPGNQRDTTERMKFTGHERDSSRDPSATGHDLDYMHARFYTPAVGRFLSVDPVTSVARNLKSPQGWNRYAYARNNPLARVDMNGLTDITILIQREAEVTVTQTDKTEVTGTPGSYAVSGGEGTLNGRTMEREDNGNQKLGRIPAGAYNGDTHESPHFKKELVGVLDVPNRSAILIHAGNQPKDSEGCILIGTGNDTKTNRITGSRDAVDELMDYIGKVQEADKKKNEETKIIIDIRDPEPENH